MKKQLNLQRLLEYAKIYLAHRMRAVSCSDKIVVLEGGTVAESRMPTELLKKAEFTQNGKITKRRSKLAKNLQKDNGDNMKKTFWDRTAKIYDRFMQKDRKAYKEMYSLICPVVRYKEVLEVATGTGLIAKNICRFTEHIEATDYSAEMIRRAKQGCSSEKLHFSVQDMFNLSYADKSFDVVIVSNALHIVPSPEKTLAEIRRVLKDGGVLIAPTFTHAGNDFIGNVKAFFMKLAGFRQYSKWTSESYLDFLREQGWVIRKSEVLQASFPLTYVECIKKGEKL